MTSTDSKHEDKGVAANGAAEQQESNYKDYPLVDIKEPLENDVIFGRGAGTNRHNKKFRDLVESRKVEYVNCSRSEKPQVAREVIRAWRAQSPPGRFLKKNKETKTWYDCGDEDAKKKTIQALRENAPKIREDSHDNEQSKTLNNMMAPPPTSGNVQTPLLRNYSLGGNMLDNYESGSSSSRSTVSPNLLDLPPGPMRDTSLGVFPAFVAQQQHTVVTSSCSPTGPLNINSWLNSGGTPGSQIGSASQFLDDLQSGLIARESRREDAESSTVNSGSKRNTSSGDDSPRTKKAQLNRDQSAAANRLKRQYIPQVFELDLENLNEQTENIYLSDRRPEPINLSARLSTKDALASWAFGKSGDDCAASKPDKMALINRQGTVDALTDWAMDTCDISDPENERRGQLIIDESNGGKGVQRPAHVNSSDRMTTLDILAAKVEGDLVPPPRPGHVKSSDRMTTLDILAAEVEGDLVPPPRPGHVKSSDRMNTVDALESIMG